MLSKKKWLPVVALLLIAFMLFGCTSTKTPEQGTPSDNQPGENTSGEPAPGAAPTTFYGVSGGGSQPVKSAKDSLVFRINAEIATLDPHKTSGTGNERFVQYQFYESLFRIENFEGSPVSEVNNALCESYQYVDDANMVLEIKVRKGVKFHCGEDLTADDVVFSLERAKASGYCDVVTNFIDHVEKVDDYTLRIYLTQAYGAILRVLGTGQLSIVCQKHCEERGDDFGRNPCGTGPYVFDEWVAGDHVSFHAFKDYWRGEAAITNGKFVVITDNNASLIAMENGEVDITQTLSGSDLPLIEENPDLSLKLSDTLCAGGRCILFNTEDPSGVFSDVRMRQAVAYAIDRQSIIDLAYDGIGEPALITMIETMPEYPTDWEGIPHDVEKAKQLVIEAGYPDGVTVKIPTIDSAIYSKATIALQDQLAEIGITLDIELIERAAWNQKILTEKDYGITYWAIVLDYDDADAALYKFSSKNSSNYWNLKNAELDELLDKGRAMETGAERSAIYRRALEIIDNEEVAVVHVQNPPRNVAHSAKLMGVVASPEQKYYFYNWYWAD